LPRSKEALLHIATALAALFYSLSFLILGAKVASPYSRSSTSCDNSPMAGLGSKCYNENTIAPDVHMDDVGIVKRLVRLARKVEPNVLPMHDMDPPQLSFGYHLAQGSVYSVYSLQAALRSNITSCIC